MENKAIVLLSGGLDSATALAVANEMEHALHCISFDYGQKHSIELTLAKKQVAAYPDAKHILIKVPSAEVWGKSALTTEQAVPEHDLEDIGSPGLPATYVPARNTVFLSLASGYAEVIDACAIFTGFNIMDYSGYPDCRPEFVQAFQTVLDVLAIAKGRNIAPVVYTPLIHLSKADIIAKGLELGVNYADTWSCYDPLDCDPQGLHEPTYQICGKCDSCKLRAAGFAANGIKDPAIGLEYRV